MLAPLVKHVAFSNYCKLLAQYCFDSSHNPRIWLNYSSTRTILLPGVDFY